MALLFQRVLMGLGACTVPLRWSPELRDIFAPGRHLLLYDGEELVDSYVLPYPPEWADGNMAITGAGPEWWYGVDTDGPLIVEREYPSGNEVLSDPDFAQGDLHYSVRQPSLWQFIVGGASLLDDGAGSGGTTDPRDHDDILTANEQRWTRAGHQWRLTAKLWGRPGLAPTATERLRLTFGGLFANPYLLLNGNFAAQPGDPNYADWTALPTDTPFSDMEIEVDPATGRPAMKCGPNTQWQRVVDPDLANGLTDYAYGVGFLSSTGWNAFLGTAETPGGIGSPKWIQPIAHPGVSTPFEVAPGEKYRWEAVPLSDPGTAADGVVALSVLMQGGPDPDRFEQGPSVDTRGMAGATEQRMVYEFAVPAGRLSCVPTCEVRDHTTDYWFIKGFRLTRLVGNRATRIGATFPVTGERRYRLRAKVRAGEGYADGEVWAQITLTSPTHEPVTIESTHIKHPGVPGGSPTRIEWEFSPPSGSDLAQPMLVSQDVVGGPLWISECQIVDLDTGTRVVDVLLPQGASGTYTLDATAPPGATDVTAEVVVEAGSIATAVTQMSLRRINVTPTTTAQIVRDMLEDPDTGRPYGTLTPGRIFGVDVILTDWRIVHLHPRAVWTLLARGGKALPYREWRSNPDFTFDFGTPAQLDRGAAPVVLTEHSAILRNRPQLSYPGVDRLSSVKVFGADRRLADGSSRVVSGSASADVSDFLDRFGNRLNRTRLVEDSQVDYDEFASARAAYELERQAAQSASVRVEISSPRAYGWIREGDTVLVYLPDANLEDRANEVAHEGETIWPVAIRVAGTTLQPAREDFSLRVLGPGQSFDQAVDISDWVIWETATSLQLDLGAHLPDPVADPQGRGPGVQFTAARASLAAGTR